MIYIFVSEGDCQPLNPVLSYSTCNNKKLKIIKFIKFKTLIQNIQRNLW